MDLKMLPEKDVNIAQGPLLLTWININPCMDK